MKTIILSLLILFSCIFYEMKSQSLNFGLSHKQNKTELPNSQYSFKEISLTPNSYITTNIETINSSSSKYNLNTGWKLIEEHKIIAAENSIFDYSFNTNSWYEATVPGTILTTLVDREIYPDPYWGLNNLQIPDTLCRMNWWYRKEFFIDKHELGNNINLVFNGINYKSEVWLNGTLLGTINGAFTRGGVFNISDLVVYGNKNILAVRIIPPHNPGIPHEANSEGQGPNGGVLCLDGPTFIASEGWDWIPGIRDRNIGIWQDVLLTFGSSEIELDDIQVITDLPLPDTTHVDLEIKTRIRNLTDQVKDITLSINIDNINASIKVQLDPLENKNIHITKHQLEQLWIKNPKLWWPNGYGQQHLYSMNVRVLDAEQNIMSEKNTRFGVRELEYELTAYNEHKDDFRINYNPITHMSEEEALFDNNKKKKTQSGIYIPYLNSSATDNSMFINDDNSMSPHMVIRVNGQRIFCKGGNWGMDDAMKRVSRERLEPYFKLHKEMNYTMIRNWTGENTEETFFDLCDEYGLLVFNDFWLSTEGYNLNVADDVLFLNNVRDVVKRFRNHPSIAIWCARNEGFAPPHLEEGISKIIKEEDGTRHYLPNSIDINMTTSGPWDYKSNITEYYSTLAGGFKTEIGTHALPTSETVRSMMSIEDTWPISDVWYYHDWHMIHIGEKRFSDIYKDAIDSKLGDSNNLDDFCEKAQIINYESYRAIFEAWNSKMWNNTSGVLIWMSHPAWPSMVWQTYSYDGETTGAYFGSKKACEPLHIQISPQSYSIDIINTTLNSYNDHKVDITIYSIDGKKLYNQIFKVKNIEANCLTHAGRLRERESYSDLILVELKLIDKKGEIISQNMYLDSKEKDNVDYTALNTLPQIKLNVSDVKINEDNKTVVGSFYLSNPTSSIAASIKLNIINKFSGERVLPSFFSDGYFFLLPGESRKIYFETSSDNSPLQLRVKGYNIIKSQITIN